jgi:hypothetical protein
LANRTSKIREIRRYLQRKIMKLKPIFPYLLPIVMVLIMLAVYSGVTRAANHSPIATPPSANENIADDSTQWATIFTGINSFSNVIQTGDGRFLAIGSPEHKEPTALVKFNPDGTLLWQKTYADPDPDLHPVKLRSVIELSDTTLVMVGSFRVATGENNNAYVARLDQNGSIIWQKEIGGEDARGAYDVILLDNDQFLVVGSHEPGSLDFGDGWLIRMDASGNIIWQKRYGDDNLNAFAGGLRTSDGNIVLYGQTAKDISFASTDAWVVKINGSGDILWQKSYDNMLADYFNELIESDDGDLFAAGVTNDATPQEYPWAVKLSGDGTLIWERTWPHTEVHVFQSVAQLENGRLVFAGNYLHLNGRAEGWLVGVDENTGLPLWQKSYGVFESYQWFNKIIPAGSGDVLVVGDTEIPSDPFQTGWVLRLTENGIVPDCSLISPATFSSNATSATTATTTAVSQATSHEEMTEDLTQQTLAGSVENQCYHQVDFTNFFYLPGVFSAPQ